MSRPRFLLGLGGDASHLRNGQAPILGFSTILFVLLVLQGASGISSPPAGPAYAPHAPILIASDADFTPANGVVGGTGTPTDPFVIEGWEIDTSVGNGIDVRDTRASFVVRNISAVRSSAGHPYNFATYLVNVTDAQLEHINAMNGVQGVSIRSSDRVHLAHLIQSALDLTGVYIETSDDVTVSTSVVGANIFAYNAANLTISSNHVRGPNSSIVVRYSGSVLIDSNVVDGTNSLIRVNATHDVVIARNQIVHGWMYVGPGPTNNTTVSDNEVRGGQEGIAAVTASNVTIERNNVSSTVGSALRLEGSSDAKVRLNRLTDSAIGVFVRWTRDVSVWHNDLAGNQVQGIVQDSVRISWNDSYPSGGNFWSDYAGVDNCSGPNQDVCPAPDGIGDTPYGIDANNSDRYPWIRYLDNDTTPPSVSIGTPTEGSVLHASPVNVSGTASDSGGSGLRSVEVRANGRPWVAATGRLSWQASLDLDPGANSLQARAWDAAGNPSSVALANVTYEAPPPPPNTPPNVNFSWSPFQADTNTTVNFTARVFDDRDPPEAIQVRWDWESDGTWDTSWSVEKVAQHRFLVADTYNVTVEALDTGGLTASQMYPVPITEPPPPHPPPLSVQIAVTPTSGTMPLTVSFTSDVTGGAPPYEYHWILGDGGESPAANTVHIYLTGGNFTVWLIAYDTAGQSEVSNAMWVNVTPAAVNLTVSQPSNFFRTSDGTMVTLRATVSGGTAPYTYLWDFGDGETSSEIAPTHLYSAPGKYRVQVRVTDSQGQVATVAFDLAIPMIEAPRFGLDPLWIAVGVSATFAVGIGLGFLGARRRRRPKPPRAN